MTFEAIDIQQTNGAQIICIPERMKIADDKVYLRKLGNTLFVIPFHNPWQSLFESLDNFTQDFIEDRNQPTPQDCAENEDWNKLATEQFPSPPSLPRPSLRLAGLGDVPPHPSQSSPLQETRFRRESSPLPAHGTFFFP
ncbi:MAG: antitoxin [Saprospiraceae bacterium]